MKDHSGHHPHQPRQNSMTRSFKVLEIKVVNRTEEIPALGKLAVYHVPGLSYHTYWSIR